MNESRRVKASLEIRDLKAAPGSSSSGAVKALELADGSFVEYPLMLIAGAAEGPTIYIGAAIHGDEINGIEIVHEVIRRVDPKTLKGNIICVPIQNPLALRMQHRLPLQTMLKSPMDQFPGDPWISFPGDENGNSAQIMAAVLFDLMRRADYVIDIHTPTSGGRYVPFVFLPGSHTASVRDQSMEVARAFGPDFILAADEGMYVAKGCLHVAAAEQGIPAFGIELGEGGRVEAAMVKRGSQGVLNVLRHLEMLSEPPGPLPSPRIVRSMSAVRTSRGGLLHMEAELGTAMAEGDLLASITDSFGEIVETIRCPHAGPLMRLTTFPTVSSGERVAQIGVEI